MDTTYNSSLSSDVVQNCTSWNKLRKKGKDMFPLIFVILCTLFCAFLFLYGVHFLHLEHHRTEISILNVQTRLTLLEEKMGHLLGNSTSNAAILDQIGRMQLDLEKTKDNLSMNLRSYQVSVKEQLGEEKKNLQSVVSGINSEMQSTQTKINTQLKETKIELEDAMVEAKQVIKSEVDNVKKSMDVYISVTNQKLSAESDFIKYEIAGTFTLLGCMTSMWHVSRHIRHMGKPTIQRRILAILWMAPIYGITSWMSLVFPGMENFLSAVRDCYEAYAVYTFMAWLVAVLSDDNGREVNAVTVLSKHVRIACTRNGHKSYRLISPPIPCCKHENNVRSLAATVLYQCQTMALQFVLLKPLLAALPILLETCGIGYYNVNVITDSHQVNWAAPKLYVILALNVSVAIAFYGLLNFYHATKDILAWCDPWPKFLCIKGVVFMTFWQGFAINVLSGAGLVDDVSARSAQDFIICIEMFIASILHVYIFPYEEWQEGYKKVKEQSIIFRDTLALKDFVDDIKGMIYKRAFEDILHTQDDHDNDNDIDIDNDNDYAQGLDVGKDSGSGSYRLDVDAGGLLGSPHQSSTLKSHGIPNSSNYSSISTTRDEDTDSQLMDNCLSKLRNEVHGAVLDLSSPCSGPSSGPAFPSGREKKAR